MIDSDKALLESQLARNHPKWRLETIQHIATAENEFEKVKLEVLYETSCVKCGRQMGEHPFSNGRFVCLKC